jgi:chromosome segregation ATPase
MNKEGGTAKSVFDPESQQEEIEELTMAIQSERETQRSIEIHIGNFQKKITEKRKNYMGVNSGAENESNLQKQIKILENRLDKANQKFNETTANNRELKNLIDSFRRERVIFDNLYKKLEKELHERRKKMADIIERANNAYEERDKAHNQIQTLKIQAKKEAGEFEKEIKEMSYLMEKIKLSSYGRRKVAEDKALFSNFYEGEQLMGGGESRMLKYQFVNPGQRRRIRSRWRRSRSSGRISRRSRRPPTSRTSTSCCASSARMRRRTSRCSNLSTCRAMR